MRKFSFKQGDFTAVFRPLNIQEQRRLEKITDESKRHDEVLRLGLIECSKEIEFDGTKGQLVRNILRVSGASPEEADQIAFKEDIASYLDSESAIAEIKAISTIHSLTLEHLWTCDPLQYYIYIAAGALLWKTQTVPMASSGEAGGPVDQFGGTTSHHYDGRYATETMTIRSKPRND